jgi:hypothetical protein
MKLPESTHKTGNIPPIFVVLSGLFLILHTVANV